MTNLNSEFVRSQFSALSEPENEGWVFVENAGGTYPCRSVVEAMNRFYSDFKIQPFGHGPMQKNAGDMMVEGRQVIADLFGLKTDEITLGPSTTQNFNSLAMAFAHILKEGDEIIICEQDHEANLGCWERAAKLSGAKIRIWNVDSQTGLLDLGNLEALLNKNTKLLSFTHSSNVAATENLVAKIASMARENGTFCIVDGVSYAPHGLPDIAGLGVDAYCFSTYKTFGTHMGVMYTSRELDAVIEPQCHFFNRDKGYARLDTAGPDHAGIAALSGLKTYFEGFYAEHFDGSHNSLYSKAMASSKLMRDYEKLVAAPVLETLKNLPVRIIGATNMSDREPNLAFTSDTLSSARIVEELAADRIAAKNDHFYAYRLCKALGVDSEDGVVRISFAHYNTHENADRIVKSLQRIFS